MLVLNLKTEYWDEEKEEFINTNGGEIHLEHSLISISKWESKWKKSFINSEKQLGEELYDYIRCMAEEDISVDLVKSLGMEVITQIVNYINDPMSATTITSYGSNRSPNREIVTSELIYYWMIALNIPFECQTWHLNRLLKLIEVCNLKNNPKKMGRNDILRQNRDLNAARRKALQSKG